MCNENTVEQDRKANCIAITAAQKITKKLITLNSKYSEKLRELLLECLSTRWNLGFIEYFHFFDFSKEIAHGAQPPPFVAQNIPQRAYNSTKVDILHLQVPGTKPASVKQIWRGSNIVLALQNLLAVGHLTAHAQIGGLND